MVVSAKKKKEELKPSASQGSKLVYTSRILENSVESHTHNAKVYAQEGMQASPGVYGNANKHPPKDPHGACGQAEEASRPVSPKVKVTATPAKQGFNNSGYQSSNLGSFSIQTIDQT